MTAGNAIKGFRVLAPALLLLVLAALARPSLAGVAVLSNLLDPSDSQFSFSSSQWVAVDFDAGESARVTRVELRGISGFGALSSGTRVRFYENDGTAVGVPINDGSATDATSAYIPYESDDGNIITFDGEVIDLPSAGTYWLAFSNDSSQSLSYSTTSGPGMTEPGWAYGSRYATGTGGSWGSPSTANFTDQYKIVVSQPGISVSPDSGLMTTEAGGTDSFSVSLDAQPTADVTLDVGSSDTGEATVSPASLTFTSDNWDTAQTVTVSGADDALADGDQAFTITTAKASSTDSAYNGLNPADVAGTNSDNDSAGITVSGISGDTSEAGATAQFTVVLGSQPTADVSLGLSSDDTSEGTVSPSQLTFTPANWDSAQSVTVTGVDDTDFDGDQAYNVVIDPASSGDPDYNGRDPGDVAVTNTDDETADPADDSNNDGLGDADALEAGLDPEVADGDTDGDGTSDIHEIGDPAAPMDSDGDGVIDALEPGAKASDASVIAFRVTDRAADAAGAAELAGGTMTLRDNNGGTLQAPSSRAVPLMSESEAPRPDSLHRFPLGLMDFSVTAPSGRTTVTLELPDEVLVPSAAGLRKLDADNRWQRFSAGTIDRDAGRITLPLIDNGNFDGNPDAGVIRDPVGLGVHEGGDRGGGTGWPALFIAGLLLLARPGRKAARFR